MNMDNVSPVVAFSAGVLSFLSPCVLPLVPVYLASLCGPEILGSEAGEKRLPVFLHALSFVIGFSVVFTALGAIAGLTGFAVSPDHVVLSRVSGSLLVVLGVFMLAALKVPWLNYEKRLVSSAGGSTGYLRSFLVGAIFCMAWTPCVGPILGGVLALALNTATVWKGAYLLALYSLGLGVPFLVIGAAFGSVSPLLKSIYRYSTWVYVVSGLLLVAMGALILTNKLVWIYSIGV
jgi:cytochrome c-type biogenesis protein